MRKDKYATDIGWEALSTYVRDHRATTGLDCHVVLHFGDGPGGDDWAEARILSPGRLTSSQPTVTVRGKVPGRQISRVVSALLHLVAQAYQELELSPWLWAPERRRAARGEE